MGQLNRVKKDCQISKIKITVLLRFLHCIVPKCFRNHYSDFDMVTNIYNMSKQTTRAARGTINPNCQQRNC